MILIVNHKLEYSTSMINISRSMSSRLSSSLITKTTSNDLMRAHRILRRPNMPSTQIFAQCGSQTVTHPTAISRSFSMCFARGYGSFKVSYLTRPQRGCITTRRIEQVNQMIYIHALRVYFRRYSFGIVALTLTDD